MAHPRFSLRWLLLIVLIVAAYLGGFVHGGLLSLKREALHRAEAARMAQQAAAERLRAEQISAQLRQALGPSVEVDAAR